MSYTIRAGERLMGEWASLADASIAAIRFAFLGIPCVIYQNDCIAVAHYGR